MFKAGIDEAGKGSLVGDLVIAMVVCTSEHETHFRNVGVKDSKKLSPKRREELYNVIVETATQVEHISISADDIDRRREEGETLNQIELKAFLELFKRCQSPETINLYLDSIDVNCERFGKHFTGAASVCSEHKADNNHICVAAASIVAKTLRDRNVAKISEELNIHVGSGYPSDSKTRNAIKEWYKQKKEIMPYTRKSWKSCIKILQDL